MQVSSLLLGHFNNPGITGIPTAVLDIRYEIYQHRPFECISVPHYTLPPFNQLVHYMPLSHFFFLCGVRQYGIHQPQWGPGEFIEAILPRDYLLGVTSCLLQLFLESCKGKVANKNGFETETTMAIDTN